MAKCEIYATQSLSLFYFVVALCVSLEISEVHIANGWVRLVSEENLSEETKRSTTGGAPNHPLIQSLTNLCQMKLITVQNNVLKHTYQLLSVNEISPKLIKNKNSFSLELPISKF